MSDLSKRIAALSPEQRALLEARLQRPDPARSQAQTILPIPSRETTPLQLSFAQERLWILDQLEPGTAAYNIPAALRLDGRLDVEALRQAFNAITRRHESLRTTFTVVDGHPIQVVAPALALALPVESLRHIPSAEREAAAFQRALEEFQAGFDLSQGPLIRARLLQLDTAAHMLLLTMHHIISDGLSMGVLIREVAALYNRYATGQPDGLPDLPIQYADFAHWQRQWLQGSVLERQISYWRERLADAPPLLGLPTDRPRPPIQTYNGATCPIVLADGLSEEVRAFCTQEGVTLFMLLLAAFDVLLYRYSRQPDICVGSFVTNRSRRETEGLIGFFVNTLVFRADLSGQPGFRELLRRVREVTLDAYAHQDVPFEQLLGALQPRRDMSHTPWFQAMFVLQYSPVAQIELSDLTISHLNVGTKRANFDLTLWMFEGLGDLTGSLEYNTDLFDEATVARMARQFVTLLGAIVADPTRPITELPLLVDDERDLLAEWARGPSAPPADVCVHELVYAQALRAPDAVAVVFERRPTTDDRRLTTDHRPAGTTLGGDDHMGAAPIPSTQHPAPDTRNVGRFTTESTETTEGEGGATQRTSIGRTMAFSYPDPQHPTPNTYHLSYGELDARASQLAGALRRLGIGPGAHVGVCVGRSPELIVGLLGVLKTGGAYVPLDPALPPERMAFMIDDARIALLITTNDQRPTTNDQWALAEGQPTIGGLITLVRLGAPTPTPNPQPPTPDQLAYVIYTSGSTGQPKGVMVPQRALSSYTQTAVREYALGPGDRVLQFASVSFDTSAEEIFPCLASGATLVLRDDQMLVSGALFLETCGRWGVSVLDLPTAYWHELVRALDGAGAALPPGLRLVLIGGEQALPERLAAWWSRAGRAVRLVNTYGPTETTIVATIADLPAPDQPAAGLPHVPIGRPIANLETYVLDDYGRLAAVGLPGELYIGGIGLAYGYLNRPDLTAERFIPNPFTQGIGDRGWGMGGDGPIPQSLSPTPRLYRTGDLVRWRADSTLEFLGRVDAQVKIRGFRIELGEIEAALAAHPTLRDAVVLVREDRPAERRLVAYIVPTTDHRPAEADTVDSASDATPPASIAPHRSLSTHRSELIAFLRKRLPEYMVPSAFVVLEAFPLLPSGKVDRQALPVPTSEARVAPAATFVEPRSPVEELLVDLWKQILGVAQVGVYDNFFDLGGHSLLATQVIAHINETFQIVLPLRHMFGSPTIAELAVVIEEILTAEIADLPDLEAEYLADQDHL